MSMQVNINNSLEPEYTLRVGDAFWGQYDAPNTDIKFVAYLADEREKNHYLVLNKYFSVVNRYETIEDLIRNNNVDYVIKRMI